MTPTNGIGIGLDSLGWYDNVAFSFTATSNYTLQQIDLLLYRNGSSTNQLGVYLYSNSSDLPGSLLATKTNTVTMNNLTTDINGAYYSMLFNNYSIVSGTKYHVVMTFTYIDGSTYPVYRFRYNVVTGQSTSYKIGGTTWSTDSANSQGCFKAWGV